MNFSLSFFFLRSNNAVLSATPRNTSCVPDGVTTSPGEKVTVTCRTWSYPEATSVWKLPNGTVIYNERMPLFTTFNRVGCQLGSVLNRIDRTKKSKGNILFSQRETEGINKEQHFAKIHSLERNVCTAKRIQHTSSTQNSLAVQWWLVDVCSIIHCHEWIKLREIHFISSKRNWKRNETYHDHTR